MIKMTFCGFKELILLIKRDFIRITLDTWILSHWNLLIFVHVHNMYVGKWSLFRCCLSFKCIYWLLGQGYLRNPLVLEYKYRSFTTSAVHVNATNSILVGLKSQIISIWFESKSTLNLRTTIMTSCYHHNNLRQHFLLVDYQMWYYM